MEYLVIAVILYFIVQTAGNLLHLLQGDGDSASDEGPSGRQSSTSEGWGGGASSGSTRSRSDPRYWGEDIEDATWQDLPD